MKPFESRKTLIFFIALASCRDISEIRHSSHREITPHSLVATENPSIQTSSYANLNLHFPYGIEGFGIIDDSSELGLTGRTAIFRKAPETASLVKSAPGAFSLKGLRAQLKSILQKVSHSKRGPSSTLLPEKELSTEMEPVVRQMSSTELKTMVHDQKWGEGNALLVKTNSNEKAVLSAIEDQGVLPVFVKKVKADDGTELNLVKTYALAKTLDEVVPGRQMMVMRADDVATNLNTWMKEVDQDLDLGKILADSPGVVPKKIYAGPKILTLVKYEGGTHYRVEDTGAFPGTWGIDFQYGSTLDAAKFLNSLKNQKSPDLTMTKLATKNSFHGRDLKTAGVMNEGITKGGYSTEVGIDSKAVGSELELKTIEKSDAKYNWVIDVDSNGGRLRAKNNDSSALRNALANKKGIQGDIPAFGKDFQVKTGWKQVEIAGKKVDWLESAEIYNPHVTGVNKDRVGIIFFTNEAGDQNAVSAIPSWNLIEMQAHTFGRTKFVRVNSMADIKREVALLSEREKIGYLTIGGHGSPQGFTLGREYVSQESINSLVDIQGKPLSHYLAAEAQVFIHSCSVGSPTVALNVVDMMAEVLPKNTVWGGMHTIDTIDLERIATPYDITTALRIKENGLSVPMVYRRVPDVGEAFKAYHKVFDHEIAAIRGGDSLGVQFYHPASGELTQLRADNILSFIDSLEVFGPAYPKSYLELFATHLARGEKGGIVLVNPSEPLTMFLSRFLRVNSVERIVTIPRVKPLGMIGLDVVNGRIMVGPQVKRLTALAELSERGLIQLGPNRYRVEQQGMLNLGGYDNTHPFDQTLFDELFAPSTVRLEIGADVDWARMFVGQIGAANYNASMGLGKPVMTQYLRFDTDPGLEITGYVRSQFADGSWYYRRADMPSL